MSRLSAQDVADTLRREHRGVLAVSQSHGEWSIPVRWVIDGRTGKLVISHKGSLSDAESVVLFVPDESQRSLQVLLAPEEITDWRTSEPCDRWLAYHGRADGNLWSSLSPVGYRQGTHVLDAEDVDLANPLHPAEPRLCKLANTHRPALATLATKQTGDLSPGALCVGIDPTGIDIRIALGILRIDFPEPAATAEQAQARLQALLEQNQADA